MTKSYYSSGPSSIEKPTGSNIPIGALYLETDTGDEFVWKVSGWMRISTAGAVHTTQINASTQQKNFTVPPLAPVPVATLLVKGRETLTLSVAVKTYALGGFEVWYKHSEEQDDWIKRASLAADYTTPNAPILAASGDLTTQAVGTGWVQIDTRGVYAVQIRAKNTTPATWAAATAYALGAIVRPAAANNFRYVAMTIAGTGTSGAAEPTFPTVLGATVIDNAGANQITWQAITDASIVTIDSGAA